MKKKIAVALLLGFIGAYIVLGEQSDFGQEQNESVKRRFVSFGAGLGIPYGVIGPMIEFSPIAQLGLTVGAGYAIEGVGYGLGLRILPLGQKKFTPVISGYFGTVAYVLGEHETVPGWAFGGGGRIMFHTNSKASFSITCELLYTTWKKEKWGDSEDSQIKFSLGGQVHI